MGGRSSKSGGYSDNVYTSRRRRGQGGFESTSRCCCFYVARSALVIILILGMVAIGGMNVLCVVLGRSQHWTYSVDRSVNPAYSIRTGWLYFSDNRMQAGTHVSLKELANGCYILGIIALVMNALSFLFAVFFGIRCLCGRVGRGFICFSIPFSILLIASLGGYYIVTALEVWKRGQNVVDAARVPWPDYAWGLGAGSALLWFIAAGVASVLPKRDKYYDAENEFEASHVSPVRQTPLSQRSTPPQDNPVYVPSSPEPALQNGYGTPMAAMENPVEEVSEGKKRSFVPTWGRGKNVKPSAIDASPANGSASGQGSYRSRADEIASRYRTRTMNVEQGPPPSAPPPPPKGAW